MSMLTLNHLKPDLSTPDKEFKYITDKMENIFAKYGHLTMLFDHVHDETIPLLSNAGYEVIIKSLLGKNQIAVTNIKPQKKKHKK